MLTVTQMLRELGVVGKFVEFFGDGLKHLPLADSATLANMAPEYRQRPAAFSRSTARASATCACPGDAEAQAELVEAYARAQGMWREDDGQEGRVQCRVGTGHE